MKIPMLDLVRQYETIREEIDSAIHEVVQSGRFILGPFVEAFESKAAEYCGVKHAIGVASGTDALSLSLKALDIGPGDAVILPSFTFFATAGVVHNVGATPVFCDIDPRTFNLDPEHLRSILADQDAARGLSHVAGGGNGRSTGSEQEASSTSHTPHTTHHKLPAPNHMPQATGSEQEASSTSHEPHTTSHGLRFRAIIPVHLYGQMADMDEIMEIANEHDLAVIEDAAQSIGAEYWGGTRDVASSSLHVGSESDEVSPPTTGDTPPTALAPQATNHTPHTTGHKPLTRKAGSIGHLGCFSFYPTKNLGAYGDGGMITTDDDGLADRLRLLRVHGARPKYIHRMVGINSRLDAIQAAILSVKLCHLDEWSTARRRIADAYDATLSGVQGLEVPFRATDRTHIFHQYTVSVLNGRRDALREHLVDQGIGTIIYYPRPLHLQECFAHLGYRKGELPVSERASEEALSLPVFPEMDDKEIDAVVQGTAGFLKAA